MRRAKNSIEYSALIAWLKDARINKGFSMRDLGALLDEPHSVVAKVENGERRLDLYEYIQYCQALNLDPAKGMEFLR